MRVTISIAVWCALFSTVAISASASPVGGVPSCEALLTEDEAADVMGEDEASLMNREVLAGDIRDCDWLGGTKGRQALHGLGVIWGSYADFRKTQMSPDFRRSVCGGSKAACRELAAALDPKKHASNLGSFAALSSALDRVGSVRHLDSGAFDGNKAFLWSPGDDTGLLKNSTFVLVYDRASRHMLVVLCAEYAVGGRPIGRALPCAIRAAKRSYNNITS